jgi:general secretion pathway protein D
MIGGYTGPQRLGVQSKGVFEPQKNVKLIYGPLPKPASADRIALIGPMQVPEFLDVLSAATGWNIASSPGVKNVNLEFWINDQTPEQAMQVLKAEEIFYEYAQDSNMIFVMTKDEFLERRHGEVVRRVFQIKHADLSALQTGITAFLSKSGRFIADPRTSTIEVHDIMDNLHYIERLINQVDQPRRESTTYALEHVNGSALFASLEVLLSESGRISYDPRSNTLIVLDRAQQQKQIAETIKALDTPVDTRTWTLNYADIFAVSDQLYTLIPDGTGIISLDQELRMITVSAMASRLDKVDERIKVLDTERKQVQIEAYLVTVGSAVVRSLGIDWGFRQRTGEGFSSTKFGAPVLFGGDNEANDGEGEDGSGSALEQLSSGLVSTFLSDNGNLTAVLDALETSGEATVNAHPRVTVLDGEEAHFQNVTQVPFATTSERNNNQFNANSVTSTRIEFIDVGTILSVLPRINDDSKVWMSISSEDSSFTIREVVSNDRVTSVPEKTQNVAQTVVVVNDRETIVLGGLSTSSLNDTTNKVPIIGDIPIFGRLFRKTEKNHSKKELLIFITPTIIDGSTQQEAYYLAELDQESSMTHFDDRKGDVHRNLDDFLSNDATISIGHRGGIVINGDFMKMSEAREFIQGPGAKGKHLVIRPHPRSPKRVLNKVVDIAIDANRSYELDNSPMPFVPSTSQNRN